MKKRIFYSLTLISALAMASTLLLALWIFYAFAVQETSQTLYTDCQVLRQALELSALSPKETLRAMAASQEELRVTLIDREGQAVYDSVLDPAGMENQLDCPEVRDALATGRGESRRPSGEPGSEFVYCALRLPDGSVLRAARQQKGILTAAAPLLPLLCGVVLVLLLLGVVISSRTTRHILQPMEVLAEHLELDGSVPDSGVYKELTPFLGKIQGQQRMIRQQMEELADDRGTIKAITGNMREGLIIVGPQKNILSVNSSAIALLGAAPGDWAGRDIGELSQLPELADALSSALEGRAASLTAWCGQLFCRLFANPVYQEQELTGAILLILDDTEREKSEKMRRDFSANVSHELRTPLTSISGFAEMIETGMAGEKTRDFAGRITRESVRLQTLIDDIIRLSRLDEHAPAPMARVSLTAVCREVLTNLSLVAHRRGVTMKLCGPEVWVRGNPGMLDELVTNLCENAIKYNREEGSVVVETGSDPAAGTAFVTVRDTGIGIPAASFQRIFERFYRVDKSRSKQTGGTGLGLSIAKHLVECHQGTISLESTLGEGSAFTVTLPAWREEGAQ